jgi:hypothetical protein
VTLFTLPESVKVMSIDLTLIAGIVASTGVLLHRRSPLRRVLGWVFRRNIGQPVSVWARTAVRGVVQPMFDILHEENTEQHAANNAKLTEVSTKLQRIEVRQIHIQNRVDGIDARLHAVEDPGPPTPKATEETP